MSFASLSSRSVTDARNSRYTNRMEDDEPADPLLQHHARSSHWAQKKARWQREQQHAADGYSQGGLFASLGQHPQPSSHPHAHALTHAHSEPPLRVRWRELADSPAVTRTTLPPVHHAQPPSQSHSQPTHHSYLSSLNELTGGPSANELASKRAAMLIYQRDLAAQMSEKAERQRRERAEKERRDRREDEEARDWNPFGRGGAGAPMRDLTGNVIADRRQAAVTSTTITTTAPVADTAASRRLDYQRSLAEQVAEKRRRAEEEQRRREEDERRDERRLQANANHSLDYARTGAMRLEESKEVLSHSRQDAFHSPALASSTHMLQVAPIIAAPAPLTSISFASPSRSRATLPPRADRSQAYDSMLAEMERLRTEIAADSEKIKEGRERRAKERIVRQQQQHQQQLRYRPLKHNDWNSDWFGEEENEGDEGTGGAMVTHSSLILSSSSLPHTARPDTAGPPRELLGHSEFIARHESTDENYSEDTFEQDTSASDAVKPVIAAVTAISAVAAVQPAAESPNHDERPIRPSKSRKKWNDSSNDSHSQPFAAEADDGSAG